MAASAHTTLDQLKLAMSATNDLFSTEVVANRNFSALDLVYTEDARILPPGASMVAGRAGITEFWSNLIQAADVKSAVLRSLDVMPSGDGIVEIGRATLTMESSPVQLEAKYVVYWRQEDGRWKWHVDIWNENS